MRKFVLILLISAMWLEDAGSFKIIRSKRSSDDVPSRCLEPPDTGPCRAGFEKYYFDPSSDKCETFTYGGCEGNANNFWSKEICEAVCTGTETADENNDYDIWEVIDPLIQGLDDCEYPADEGQCRAAIPQYFFNGENCELFTYGGCGGNPNRFSSEEECMERCGTKTEDETDESDDYNIWEVIDPLIEGLDDCEYPANGGQCLAAFPQYFFNGENCELFTYSGCGGNPNRFASEEECMERCGTKPEVESDSIEE